MSKVGKIDKNKATFFSLEINVDINTCEVESDVFYDTRLLDETKEKELRQLCNTLAIKIFDMMELLENNKDEKKNG